MCCACASEMCCAPDTGACGRVPRSRRRRQCTRRFRPTTPPPLTGAPTAFSPSNSSKSVTGIAEREQPCPRPLTQSPASRPPPLSTGTGMALPCAGYGIAIHPLSVCIAFCLMQRQVHRFRQAEAHTLALGGRRCDHLRRLRRPPRARLLVRYRPRAHVAHHGMCRARHRPAFVHSHPPSSRRPLPVLLTLFVAFSFHIT